MKDGWGHANPKQKQRALTLRSAVLVKKYFIVDNIMFNIIRLEAIFALKLANTHTPEFFF